MSNNLFIYDPSTGPRSGFRYWIKRAISPFLGWIYKGVVIWKSPKKQQKKPYYFSICAIFKNEGAFLKEWIEYHLLVGTDHFYLYNNFSDDNYREVLAPYIERGVVDLIDWPVPQGQFPAYEDFYKKYRDQTHWVALIDLDEFFCPVHTSDMKTWLSKYEKYPSVLVYWKMFGTSGKMEHDAERLVTEQYTVCWDRMDNIGKVIVNMDWKFDQIYHHSIFANISLYGWKLKIPPVNEFYKFIRWGSVCPTKFGCSAADFSMQLNHYWSKAYLSHYEKKNKGSMCPNYKHTMKQFFWSEHYNRAVDYKIFRFLIELKLAIGMDGTPEEKVSKGE